MQQVVIYTDGGARNNPGPAGAGWVIYEGDPSTGSGRLLAESKKYLGDRTNNWAEYEALILALTEARKRGLKDAEIRMDSELIVKQMKGEYKVKNKALKEQYARVRGLLAGFAEVRFVHVPREENAEADRLVNEAIDEAAASA